MASIFQRGGSYSVVYTLSSDGMRKQKWETYHTHQEAEHRKEQVELYLNYQKKRIVHNIGTVEQLMDTYVRLYGLSKWTMSTYDGNTALIRNYIVPFMGKMRLYELSPRVAAELYRRLLELPQIDIPYHRSKGNRLTPRTLESIHKLLHSAFEQAVLWECIPTNPFHKTAVPKTRAQKPQILSAAQIKTLLQNCDNPHLRIAIHLAISGSLRKGEILGLTWNDVNFKESSIHICKSLSRVSREAYLSVDKRDVIYEFPSILSSDKTVVVLKSPKTESSSREVYLPEYVLDELSDLKKVQKCSKKKCPYPDMVFKYPDGRPMLDSTLNYHFKNLLIKKGVPIVTFHSIRHSSITYKLVLSHGNIKAVQGDSGHAQAEMITELYSHILDECRKETAIRFEKAFYQDFR